MQTRAEAFDWLMKPIIWPELITHEYAQDKVYYRLQQVRLVYPFLTDTEKTRADGWLESEQHLELWDEDENC